MSQSPLTVIAITTAEPGKEEALGAAQEKLVAETLIEDGCPRYELHQSLDDDRVRIFVETWESETHWRAHMEGAAMLPGRWRRRLFRRLHSASPPQGRRMTRNDLHSHDTEISEQRRRPMKFLRNLVITLAFGLSATAAHAGNVLVVLSDPDKLDSRTASSSRPASISTS
jgi:quinol monooxygenase YgiN